MSTGGEENIVTKRAYENLVDSHGIKVKSFHVDNGIYAEKAFTDEVTVCGQTITFCGVGVHHHNGVAESYIGTLTKWARTILLNDQRPWSEVISEFI